MSSATHTVNIHRVLRASPEKVYRAFLEPDAFAKWVPPHGFTGKVHQMDVRVGGKYRMSFTNLSTTKRHSVGGTYLELTPYESIKKADSNEAPNLSGEILVSVSLMPAACGSELHITQEGLPENIPVEFCYLGWQESLRQLAHLVEPVSPD
ncbi:MAG: SRPBCC family protein [Hahellaceae bacterium]|nr:SRPBCC family protein [Hahellaceae bacterium]MCP5169342.1 SRPBCC family protein [Hahellaceae bacterium]